MLKRFGLVLLLLLALSAAAAIALSMSYRSFLATPLSVPGDGAEFTIPSGAAFSTVAKRLHAEGILSSPDWFELQARLGRYAERVQAGEYRIAPGTTPTMLLEQFVSGAVVLYSFTIVEGWNRWELEAALAAEPRLVTTLGEEDWPGFLQELGSVSDNPEGLFLPETYRFPANTTDRELLTQAHELLQDTLADAWETRATGLPLESPYEALILASIIEKETAKADERPEIAGVFIRRLLRRMRLQTDPTVIYGIGPTFNGNLTRRDLRTDTPYNTYTRGGLPPTPIAMAGQAAIHAALNPADGTSLFFVATGLGDGSHAFSDTKEQHDAAVQAYLKRLRQNRGQ
ncbi:MAG: endolytic transglycosylase MltG [Pseudomonadota bacterium]